MANDTIHAMAVKTDGALERDFEMLFNFITLCLVPDDFGIILTDFVCSYSVYLYYTTNSNNGQSKRRQKKAAHKREPQKLF